MEDTKEEGGDMAEYWAKGKTGGGRLRKRERRERNLRSLSNPLGGRDGNDGYWSYDPTQ